MIFAPDVMPVNMLYYKSKETLLMGLRLPISLFKETEMLVLQLHEIEF